MKKYTIEKADKKVVYYQWGRNGYYKNHLVMTYGDKGMKEGRTNNVFIQKRDMGDILHLYGYVKNKEYSPQMSDIRYHGMGFNVAVLIEKGEK